MSNGIQALLTHKNKIGSYQKLTEHINQAIRQCGGIPVTRSAVYKWVQKSRVPADRVVVIEQATGIPRETLRPDLYK